MCSSEVIYAAVISLYVSLIGELFLCFRESRVDTARAHKAACILNWFTFFSSETAPLRQRTIDIERLEP